MPMRAEHALPGCSAHECEAAYRRREREHSRAGNEYAPPAEQVSIHGTIVWRVTAAAPARVHSVGRGGRRCLDRVARSLYVRGEALRSPSGGGNRQRGLTATGQGQQPRVAGEPVDRVLLVDGGGERPGPR